MEDISRLLMFVALSLMLAAQMFFPRGPRVLHVLIALAVVLTGLAALFQPILVPIDRELARSLTLGAAIGATAIAIAYLVWVWRRARRSAKEGIS